MRLLASLAHYLATYDEQGVQIHQYASAELACDLTTGQRVGLRVTTDYPWQGQIKLEVTETGSLPWTLALRRPEWSPRTGLSVNGQPIDTPIVRKGYLILERVWNPGDVIDLDLRMEPMVVASNPRVDATRASLAIQRGPIIYCLEDCDQEERGRLLDVEIDGDQPLHQRWEDNLLGGVMVVEAGGRFVDAAAWHGQLYRPAASVELSDARPTRLVAIPYYAWGNRGIGGMRVWIPQK